jgi:preprotein translocase subunit YajC
MRALLFHVLAATSTTATTAAKKSSSSASSYVFLLIILLFVLVYFMYLRPRQQRMRQQQGAQRQLGIGDEVVSIGGIQGRVVALDADNVEVQVAPGVVMTFLRRAVNPKTVSQGATGGAGSGPTGGFGSPPTAPAAGITGPTSAPSGAASPEDDRWPERPPPAVDAEGGAQDEPSGSATDGSGGQQTPL